MSHIYTKCVCAIVRNVRALTSQAKRRTNNVNTNNSLILIARASTAQQSASLELQRQKAAEYAARLGISVVIEDRFCVLESGKKEHRASVEAALALVKSGRAGGILVTKLDRLGRSLEEVLRIVRELEAAGGQLVVIDQQIDTSTAQGRFFLQMLGAFAEFERNMISERTSERMAANKAAGRHVSGKVPYGFDVVGGLLQPNATEQATLSQVRAWRDAGLSIEKCCQRLNDAGKLSKCGKPWQPTALRRILERE